MDDEIGPPEGGCRTDNGRCFRRGGWDPDTELATVQFHDGSIYRFGRISEATWVDEFLDTQQPGCSWNYFWKDQPPTRWEKLTEYPSDLEHEFHE